MKFFSFLVHRFRRYREDRQAKDRLLIEQLRAVVERADEP
jgi:hypothetical protein